MFAAAKIPKCFFCVQASSSVPNLIFDIKRRSVMRLLLLLFALAFTFSTLSAQTRQEAIDKLTALKLQTRAAEEIVLSPESADRLAAAKENVNVFRLMPMSLYPSEEFSFVKGGGSVFSFYFGISDQYNSHGGDMRLQRDVIERGLAVGENNYSLMTDIGEVGLQQINPSTPGFNTLANLQNVIDHRTLNAKFPDGRGKNIEVEGVSFNLGLPAIVGHTYLIRSLNRDCYDILAAFQVRRKDADGSVIIFWKMLDQYPTPVSPQFQKGVRSDEQILDQLKSFNRSDMCPDLKISVSDGIVTLSGPVPGRYLSYMVMMATMAGATKVINLMSVK
jgi:hypothetical protein